VSIFNGFIPLVAIQMRAIRINENISLVFTTVLDEMPLGLVDEDEEIQEVADRAYWERLATKETVAMADALLEIIKTFDPNLVPKYNKFYIGLAENDRPNNFAVFRPQKNGLRLKVRLPRSEETEDSLERAGLDVMDYDKRWGGYRIRLAKGDEDKYRQHLADLLSRAYQESKG
jgi:predicted transport protein